MKNLIVPLLVSLLCIYTYAWSDEVDGELKYKDEILKIQNEIDLLNKTTAGLKNAITNQNQKVDDLNDRFQTFKTTVQSNSDSLENMSLTTSNLKKQTQENNRLLTQLKEINSERNLAIKGIQTRLQKTENNIQENSDSFENIASTTSNLKQLIQEINRSLTQLKDVNAERNLAIKGIQAHLQEIDTNIQRNSDSLIKTNTKLSDVKRNANAQFQSINNNVSKRTIYLIMAILSLILLIIVISLFLKNRISATYKLLSEKIEETKEILEAEAIKVDSKVTELLHTQLDTLKETSIAVELKKDMPDHSLPLQVGLEIYRMRNRIENMAEDTKGIGALKNSLNRLEEQFNDNGYEMIELLGKQFVDEMNVEAKFVPSDDLKPGDQIITKIIKPQINFNGVLIQIAEVEVSIGG